MQTKPKDCKNCQNAKPRERIRRSIITPDKFLYCKVRFKKVEPYDYCGSFEQETYEQFEESFKENIPVVKKYIDDNIIKSDAWFLDKDCEQEADNE